MNTADSLTDAELVKRLASVVRDQGERIALKTYPSQVAARIRWLLAQPEYNGDFDKLCQVVQGPGTTINMVLDHNLDCLSSGLVQMA
jgi:hypothetical protein